MLEEDNVSEGFFDEDEYRAVLDQLNPLLRDIAVLAYHTGWRAGSILRLPWSRVDFTTGVIRLLRGGTKNEKSTVFPINLFPELRSMLESRSTLTNEAEVRLGIDIPHVFHGDGKRVRSIWAGWHAARSRAGLPRRLIHDFRRTAVRLKKLGVPESEIMDMVGFKTRDMFNRYDITVEVDILRTADDIGKRLGIIISGHLPINHSSGQKLPADAEVGIKPNAEETASHYDVLCQLARGHTPERDGFSQDF